MRSRVILASLAWTALVVGVATYEIHAQNSDPRGDLYSAKALQALEQCFDSLGNFTCGGGDLTGTGTANTVAKWTDASTLGDSQITDDGTDISLITSTGQINIIATAVGTGDLSLFGENEVGISSGQFMSLGADTTIFLTSGLGFGGLTRFHMNLRPANGDSGEVFLFDTSVNNMNGEDAVTAVLYTLTNGNHTGTGNVLRGLWIDSITADAQAVALPHYVGSGWDSFMSAEVDADGWSADDDPPGNSVALYFDESGANCNLIARLSDGTEIVVSALVVAGDCP